MSAKEGYGKAKERQRGDTKGAERGTGETEREHRRDRKEQKGTEREHRRGVGNHCRENKIHPAFGCLIVFLMFFYFMRMNRIPLQS